MKVRRPIVRGRTCNGGRRN